MSIKPLNTLTIEDLNFNITKDSVLIPSVPEEAMLL